MEYQLIAERDDNLTPLQQVFSNRGIKPADINHYLNTSEDDILNPTLIKNIQQGAQMLIKHLYNKDKIYIVVDPDVDGFTSAAAFINYLYFIIPNYVEQIITYGLHTGKQHGIVLEEIPNDVKLVVVLDAGSSDYEEHRILKEQGIDILIIDHHEAETTSQDACVINNQICDYPNKTLSGVGMVYKFCQYIDLLLGDFTYSDKIIDLAAVGIISDMMDLKDFETREIINQGLNNIENPFLSAFVKEQAYSLKGEVTPFGVAFYIAPYINATIRMGTAEEKLLLFESMLSFRAYESLASTKRGCKGQTETRVEQACRNCKNIKNRQTKARDTSLEIIEDIIERDNLLNNPIIIIQLEESVEENLTGLIANQIMGKYQKPVLLLNRHIEIQEETGEILKFVWRGSGRNSTYSKLKNLRELVEQSGLVEYSNGHSNAFGASIPDESMEEFKTYMYNKLYYVDFIWDGNNIPMQTILDIANLSHIWGQGIAEPKIAFENICLTRNNIFLMSPDRNPTLKFSLSNGLSLIKFGSDQKEYDDLYSEQGCVNVNIVGTCHINEWNGNITPQILIEDYEIVNKSAYYF